MRKWMNKWDDSFVKNEDEEEKTKRIRMQKISVMNDYRIIIQMENNNKNSKPKEIHMTPFYSHFVQTHYVLLTF